MTKERVNQRSGPKSKYQTSPATLQRPTQAGRDHCLSQTGIWPRFKVLLSLNNQLTTKQEPGQRGLAIPILQKIQE